MKLCCYLTGPGDKAFCLRVSEALNKGWRLYGSPIGHRSSGWG
ncbi:MAG: DUF1737 domain-containing protein [Proteobacteria bacterium]|nr:DUF1737 domain-containing protein [Pseudomonadota bacterium]